MSIVTKAKKRKTHSLGLHRSNHPGLLLIVDGAEVGTDLDIVVLVTAEGVADLQQEQPANYHRLICNERISLFS